MRGNLQTIDPEWAWSEFVPDELSPWTPRLAAHLFRRAGFAANDDLLRHASTSTPGEVVESLFTTTEPEEFVGEMASLARSSIGTGDVKNLPPWWSYRLLTTPHPLLEKATLFWHGHFATSGAKVDDPGLMHTQNELLRRYALGDFSALVQEMSRDPAMLLWLDSATNRKAHPNENFARELMELFCLGEGEYTETDIRELARCFTGWEIKAERFRFNRFQHDGGRKTILGTTGPFGGEDGTQIVLEHPACPRFIVTKLIRFYLCDEPALPAALVEPLAQQLRDDRLQIAPVLRRMLSSRLFFSEHTLARKVRSPVELGIGFLRSLDGTTNTVDLAEAVGEVGQRLFFPPNVKGWDGGRTWINSSTLLGRANLIRRLLDHDKTRFGGGSLAAATERAGVRRGDEVVAHWEELLFAMPMPQEVRTHVARQIDAAPASQRDARLRDALHLIATQPEFQLA
ncbi:MAG: DUF1800 domain-containing protein [Planctomycetaceae bacterium]|nr:DUF1800 domain-containing protein [Planctomycetaceae bacterium]